MPTMVENNIHKATTLPKNNNKTSTDCIGRGDMLASSSLHQTAILFPQTQEQTKQVEDLLAQEMESLSLQERDKILFDIHGFSEQEAESKEEMDRLLEEMDRALDDTKNNAPNNYYSNRDAYVQAKYMNPKYINDRAFRVMFLRSENYDPRLAAQRFIAHFTIKRELWGNGEVLGRPIWLSDLSNDDMAMLQSGVLQVFPTRDVAGRTVFSLYLKMRVCKDSRTFGRIFWYMFMNALANDEDLQRRGYVLVVYCNSSTFWGQMEEISFARCLHHYRQGLPFILVGHHLCGLDPAVRPFMSGLQLFLAAEVRQRTKTHYGSFADIIFQLQTFGIKAADHPIRDDGSLNMTWHREWIQVTKAREDSEKAAGSRSEIELVPRRFDVLFGRGKNIREHTGNLRAGHLVDMYQKQYESVDRYGKTKIAEQIMKIIHESCGRFLRWEDPAGWVEVDSEAARDKISHFFRHNRSKSKTLQEGQPSQPPDKSEKRCSPSSSPCASPVQTNENAAKRLCDLVEV